MNVRTVIITGANSGIGRAAAHKFAAEGQIVIMACRNAEKGEKVRREVRSASGNDTIDLIELDVSSFGSIRSFCRVFEEKYSGLDILIHNAAYFNHGEMYRVSPDGIELTFATNVLGPFMLTGLLVNFLSESNDPRILNAGSNIIKHFFNPGLDIDFDNLRGEDTQSRSFSVYANYRNSKMALLMLTFKMADELKPKGIKVNAIQINGAKMSKDTLKKFRPKYRAVALLQNIFFPPPAFIAGLYYEICTSKRFESITGRLFNHKLEIMKPARQNPGPSDQFRQLFGAGLYPSYAHRPDVREKLWELCTELTYIRSPDEAKPT